MYYYQLNVTRAYEEFIETVWKDEMNVNKTLKIKLIGWQCEVQ